MLEQKEHFHGSDLEKIEKIYKIDKNDIINFAANVNPLGVSGKLKEAIISHIDDITSYPDREYTTLKKAIGTYCNCDFSNILVGSGCTELISSFIQIIAPKCAMILGPTYSEYERDLGLSNIKVKKYLLKETNDFMLDIDDFIFNIPSECDMIILCSPNNPTGGIIEKISLKKLMEYCEKENIFVMIDETYIEFVSDVDKLSAISLINDFSHLIVLRGTSKFFSAPGLRLGYASTSNQEILNRFNSTQNPWMINSLAVAAGEAMFSDTKHIQASRDLIETEKKRMYELFSNSDRFKIYTSYSNFYLLKILDKNITSNELFDKCIRNNLMIRDCSTFDSCGDRFIRFCVMMPDDNTRLAHCLLE